jgi:hypothetical protein
MQGVRPGAAGVQTKECQSYFCSPQCTQGADATGECSKARDQLLVCLPDGKVVLVAQPSFDAIHFRSTGSPTVRL